MVGADGPQRRHGLGASRNRIGAAGAEGASVSQSSQTHAPTAIAVTKRG